MVLHKILKRIFWFVLLILQANISNSLNHRDKRFLIFPRGNPTRHQFIAGIGLPLDLEPESLTVGYVLKAQYFLPYNVSHLYPTRLEKRNVDFTEDYKNDETDDYFKSTDDTLRWSIYNALDIILRQQLKINGKQCVLRYICEASQSFFSHKSGILAELLHILLVPSTTTNQRNDFTFAEKIGRSNINCEKIFNQCTFSLLDVISKF